jgi:hypothetical protein
LFEGSKPGKPVVAFLLFPVVLPVMIFAITLYLLCDLKEWIVNLFRIAISLSSGLIATAEFGPCNAKPEWRGERRMRCQSMLWIQPRQWRSISLSNHPDSADAGHAIKE